MNEKNKQLLKKIRWELIAVIVLCITFVFTIFKVAYGANANGYNTSGYFNLHVGTNSATINVSYAGTKNNDTDYSDLKDNGSHRSTFLGSSHKINVAASDTVGNISVVDTKCNTVKDSEGAYSTIFFRVKFKVPAHYYFSGTSKTDASDGALSFVEENVVSDKNRYNFPGNCGHDTAEHSETIWIRLNLSNTHMIVDSEATWHHAKLVVDSHINTYTFTYYTNGGTVKDLNEGTKSGDNVVYSRTCGGGLGRAPLLERPGYVFAGWYYDNGTRLQTSDNLLWLTNGITLCYANSGNQSVTARWTAYKHNISYDLQGGNYGNNTSTDLNGCKIIPNGVYHLKSGCGTNMYMHVAKLDDEKHSSPAVVIYTGSNYTQTKWIFERYKNTQYYYIISARNGLALSLTGAPTSNQTNNPLELWNQEEGVADYLWYLKDEGNGNVAIYNKSTNQCLDVKSAGTSNDTWVQQYNPNHAYAQWWKLETVSQKDYPDRIQFGNHNLYINSVNPERENYDFVCWNTKSDGSGTSYSPGDQYTAITTNGNPVTLYAIWNVNDFTISFDANGGTGKMDTLVKKGYEAFNLPANTFTRKGYTFIGWSTEKYPDKITYKDKANYENSLAQVTLYAQWQKNTAGFIQRPFHDAEMFRKDSSLQGEKGTPYDKDKTDSRMAHIDQSDDPGYFSNGWNK